MSPRQPAAILENTGDVVACPRGHSHCRVGSEYFIQHGGKCPKCGEPFTRAAVRHILPFKSPKRRRRRTP